MKKHKRLLLIFTAFTMVLLSAFFLASCGSAEEDASADTSAESEQPEIVKSIDEIDGESGSAKDLQISAITLFEDGSVMIETKDDLKKNEAEKIYPFKESGKVKDIYVVGFGTEGYRTVVAILDDGRISAMSAKSLIEDHIAVVRDDILGRDNFTKIETSKDDNGNPTATAYDKDGSDYPLDFNLDF